MKWGVFSRTIRSDHSAVIEEETLAFLDKLEAEGWEPRSIKEWGPSMNTLNRGVTVYARRKPE